MCQDFLNEASFYTFLSLIDQKIATEVQAGGCPHCGGKLHSARYPRKPRGLRGQLDDSYSTRLSFCCAEDDCRRWTTPPSVRFLGRKVYVGVVIILITALEHGLSPRRRKQLIETLDIWPQTIARWKSWWRTVFSESRCWQAIRGYLVPPVNTYQLPGAWLGRLKGEDLRQRLCHLLRSLSAITTTSWSGSLQVIIDPQKM